MTNFAKPDQELDTADLSILSVIQADNHLSHATIGEQVGLSTSAVRRRIRAMEQNGVIVGNMAVLDPERFGVTLILELAFIAETPERYTALDALIKTSPHIQQSYHVAGEIDYILIVHGPSLRWYEDWVGEHFTSNEHIKRVNTRVVWSRRKFDPSITFGEVLR